MSSATGNSGVSKVAVLGEAEGGPTLLTPDDAHWFNEGTHYRLHEKLGARLARRGESVGVYFAVWAPNASYVSVVGDFNGWDRGRHPMRAHASSGIWEAFIEGVGEGAVYKYHVASGVHAGYAADKMDPFGFRHEVSPRTGSVVQGIEYSWEDGGWMRGRATTVRRDEPMSIYEMHVGSWMHLAEREGWREPTYREVADRLVAYVVKMGFTHVELLPVMEHPLYRSWGYQTTGYFAPTSRFGAAQDLMFLIDRLHQAGVGVILDWVPSHFPSDEHGLGYFDGTHLYEHADPRQGFHPDWKTLIFNYGRHEVRSFLISSASFWLEKYHADALRVDAVASMLYLDYSRDSGEWVANREGGRENVEAIEFIRQLNTEVYRSFPDVCTIAEESTAWALVSRPVSVGGLGFGYKWDMGWMHDTLAYMRLDPVHRAHHHRLLTFRAMYQFSENYVLALSHDEVVHGKGSLIGKMPGSDAEKFAGLRLLLASQWMQPGKKLLFMGGEIGQWSEWSEERSVDWHVTEDPRHAGVQLLVKDLNALYRGLPALHEQDCDEPGFAWVSPDDAGHGVVAYLRRGKDPEDVALVIVHGTPVVRHDYVVGVPQGGAWVEVLNTDAAEYGGGGAGNLGRVTARDVGCHGFERSVSVTVPGLSVLVLVPEGRDGRKPV